jgi:pyridoxal phosphate enzyme (YggS family)
VAALRDRFEHVRERVAAACARVGRDPQGVVILPVSKSVDVERLRAVQAAGMTTFGENRVQEASAKAAELPSVRWHLVGHLQSNKAGRALELFDQIHSLDSIELAQRLDRLVIAAGRAPLPVYLEVNVDRDPAKSGMDVADLERALPEVAALPGLELRGLMTVGRLVTTPGQTQPTFVALRALSEQLRAAEPRLGPGLSMGMSDDFEIAVEEGATVVRIGRAIFGERPVA